MSVTIANRQIDLQALLPVQAVLRPVRAGVWEVEANIPQAQLDVAVAAAPELRDVTTQRQARRQQAIDRLNVYVAMGAGATAAQVRTESQFVAKVLAKVLPFIDLDPQ